MVTSPSVRLGAASYYRRELGAARGARGGAPPGCPIAWVVGRGPSRDRTRRSGLRDTQLEIASPRFCRRTPPIRRGNWHLHTLRGCPARTSPKLPPTTHCTFRPCDPARHRPRGRDGHLPAPQFTPSPAARLAPPPWASANRSSARKNTSTRAPGHEGRPPRRRAFRSSRDRGAARPRGSTIKRSSATLAAHPIGQGGGP